MSAADDWDRHDRTPGGMSVSGGSTAMEIEAKYRLTEDTSPEQIEALDWRPFRLGARAEIRQRDTLWDTEVMALSSSGHAVRLREAGAQPLVTLKGPGTVADGVHEREELELPADDRQPAGWPAPIKQRLHALVGDEQLLPIFEIHNHRRAWPLLENGTVVGEVALDRGTIEAGGRSQALHELEIELKGAASREVLNAVTEQLRRQLPVEPEDRSKFARGLALLHRSLS